MVECEVSVKELRELYFSGKYDIEIDTPDGYQKIGKWFDKGTLDMVRITTVDFTTECAVNHLIQDRDDNWILAGELDPGFEIKTKNGVQAIKSVDYIDPAVCYDFEVLHPNHRYYGDGIVSHNSGKSFLASGNLVRNAQKQGIFVVLIDTENALDESWLQALGVETTEDKLLKLSVSMIDDLAKIISDFVKQYKDDYGHLSKEERPKVLFVVDSLGMLLTPTDVDQFNKGDMKGDLGRKAKSLTALVRNSVNLVAQYDIGLVCTNHTYASMDMFSPDDKVSGGSGFIYASSIVIAMKKLKLKEDDEGNKISDVKGIRSACKVMKSRYSKPFESIELKIPYESGLNPYSGLFELFEKKGLLTKSGNRYSYTDSEGAEHLYFKKDWYKNTNGVLDIVMREFHSRVDINTEPVLEDIEENE